MIITTVTNREFNHNVIKAKRASLDGPVFITDSGRPTHVLLSIKDYQRLTKIKKNIVELLVMPDTADVDFKLTGKLFHPWDPDAEDEGAEK